MHGQRTSTACTTCWVVGPTPYSSVTTGAPTRPTPPLLTLWRNWSPDYRPTRADREALQASLRHPDNVRAALSYYRAHLAEGLVARYPRADGPVPSQPTLYLHGAEDRCVRPGHVTKAAPLLRAANPLSDARLVPGVGHWPHLERPDVVGDLVLSFLAGA